MGFKLFEYIERRQLLQTPFERSRLLKELPKVIADAVELKESPTSPEDAVVSEGSISSILSACHLGFETHVVLIISGFFFFLSIMINYIKKKNVLESFKTHVMTFETSITW